ncbi:MAG TPA: carbamoyl phosphate synthase large subunit, partial [Gammaproteobacteria bacterium]|nr:carbamoyl phosphate synthase large subunit [Gammaproteobacteria bacterium]
IFYLADAFRLGMSLEEVFDLSKVDPWFLAQIEDLVSSEMQINGGSISDIEASEMFALKRKGFSDARLGQLLNCSESSVRERRKVLNIKPVFKRVDSCAAEFDTQTAYLYSTYQQQCEANPTDKKKIMILGGGPNRISQGIEFDY